MDNLKLKSIDNNTLNDLLNEIDRRTIKLIKSYCKNKLEFPYFGIVKSCEYTVEGDTTSMVKKATVLINETGITTGKILNKTGENIAVNDSVIVYAINDSLSNCYIGLKCGSGD